MILTLDIVCIIASIQKTINIKYILGKMESFLKYHYERNKLVKEEKMYLHFQKKHPVIKANIESDSFLICKAGIINFNIELTKTNIVNNTL